MSLRGKIVVIAGGSGGIGRVVAARFVREGSKVVILGRRQAKIQAAIRTIGACMDVLPAAGMVCDIGNGRSVEGVMRRIKRRYGNIDILVNCAGIQKPIGAFAKISMKDWEKNIDVNLLGTVRMCHAVLPFMMKRGRGAIINFSGGGASSARPYFSAYASSKAAIVRFTEILAAELASYKIRVNAIAPGAVNTDMLNEILKAGQKAGVVEAREARKRLRTGGTSPMLAAELAVFLASDVSQPLSGRLISAPWDEWKKWKKSSLQKIMKSDALTLGRKQLLYEK